jgi:hypothetical protein
MSIAETKVDRSAADNKNGRAMYTNKKAHGMIPGVAPEVGGHPETPSDLPLTQLPVLWARISQGIK